MAGAYFITIITHRRECFLGEVIDGEVILSPYGDVVRTEWLASAEIRREIQLHDDEFVVMPNHVHRIVWIVQDERESPEETGDQVAARIINGCVGATGLSPLQQIGMQKPGTASRSLGSFVVGFKSSVTKRINQMRMTIGQPVWKRNYFDRVIRDEDELQHLRRYI